MFSNSQLASLRCFSTNSFRSCWTREHDGLLSTVPQTWLIVMMKLWTQMTRWIMITVQAIWYRSQINTTLRVVCIRNVWVVKERTIMVRRDWLLENRMINLIKDRTKKQRDTHIMLTGNMMAIMTTLPMIMPIMIMPTIIIHTIIMTKLIKIMNLSYIITWYSIVWQVTIMMISIKILCTNTLYHKIKLDNTNTQRMKIKKIDWITTTRKDSKVKQICHFHNHLLINLLDQTWIVCMNQTKIVSSRRLIINSYGNRHFRIT